MVLRTQSAQRELELRTQEFRVGRGVQDTLFECATRLKDSAIELSADKKQELKILAAYFELTKYFEKLNRSRFEVGVIKQQDLEQAVFAQLNAEVQYLKAGGK